MGLGRAPCSWACVRESRQVSEIGFCAPWSRTADIVGAIAQEVGRRALLLVRSSGSCYRRSSQGSPVTC